MAWEAIDFEQKQLFLASIHHSLDQFDGDASARNQHSDCVGGHVEEEIACQDTLDLIVPLLAATPHIAQQGVELNDHAFPFACPFVFEGINRAEVDLNGFDIHSFFMNDLRLCDRLNDFSQHLPDDGGRSHFRWYNQHIIGCKVLQVGDLGLGERLEAAQVSLLPGESVEEASDTVHLHTMLDPIQRERRIPLAIDHQLLPQHGDFAYFLSLDWDCEHLLAIIFSTTRHGHNPVGLKTTFHRNYLNLVWIGSRDQGSEHSGDQ